MARIDQATYIHPMDRALMSKIIGFPAVKKIMDKVFTEGLDEVSDYLYSVSGVQLPPEHPACQALKEGCSLFGVSPVPPVYTVRTYDLEVLCGGYSHPVVQLPQNLLDAGDEAILRGRMMAAAAAIAAGHHKISFLLYLIENFSGISGIPGVDLLVKGTLNEWLRARRYTLDRAFYLATGDYVLSLKNVLFGEVPMDMLAQFSFQAGQDTYRHQAEEYARMEKVTDAMSGVMAFLQAESWLPPRYDELKKLHAEIGGRG